MLYFLKILTTLITTGLAIFSVTTDFTEKDTKKLKPAGKWYIAIFLISVGVSFLFDKLSDDEKAEAAKKNFTNTITTIRDSTDTLLRRTKDSLDFQFNRISQISNQIDHHLAQTSKNMETQFEQTNSNQKSIKDLTGKIKTTTENTVKDLGTAITSLSNIDTQQRKSLSSLTDISNQSETSLKSINSLFNEVKSLTEPLSPLELVFKVRYKLNKPITLYTGTTSELDLFNEQNPNLLPGATLLNSKDFLQTFYKNFYVGFQFFSDETFTKRIIQYSSPKEKTIRLSYLDKDTTITRTVSVAVDNVSNNPEHLKNIEELIIKSLLQIEAYQGGSSNFLLYYKSYRQNENFKKYEYKDNLKIESITVEPAFELRTNQNYSKPYFLNGTIISEKPQTIIRDLHIVGDEATLRLRLK